MKFSFKPSSSVIRVAVQVHSFQGMEESWFALDTGATQTMIHPQSLMLAGYDPTRTTETRTTNGIGGPVTMGVLRVNAIRCLGRTLTDFPVLVHPLPTPTRLQGLLGLDFLRQGGVHIDFRTGTIELD